MIYEFQILLVSFFILFGFNIYTNYYHYKFIAFAVFVNLLVSFKIASIYTNLYGLFFFYFMGSLVWISMPPVAKHFAHPKNGNNHALSHSVLKTYVASISLGIFFIFLEKINALNIVNILKILHVINVFLTFLPKKWTMFRIQAQNYKAPICGFGANVSVNATLLSLMAPVFLINFEHNFDINGWALILTFLAILKTRASAGLISFVSSIWIFFLLYFDFSIKYFLISLSLVCLIFLICYFYIAKFAPTTSLFSVSGRDNLFRFAKKFIMPNMHKWFGLGFGTLPYIYPQTQDSLAKQDLNQFKMAHYVWMHNDILQVYMEGGIVGFLIASACYMYAFYICIVSDNYTGIAFLISYLINSATNFPNHLLPDIIVTLCFLKLINEGIGIYAL